MLKIKYFLLDLLNNIFNELKIEQHPELRIANVDGFDMQMNNLLRMGDESLKEKLINEIKNIESHTWIEKIEFTDNGFINFKYSNKYVIFYY